MRKFLILLLAASAVTLSACSITPKKFYQVRFTCQTEGVRVTVRRGDVIIAPEGSDALLYRLEPGDYVYDYECEGYITVIENPLHVEGPVGIVLELTENPEPGFYEAPLFTK